MPNEVVRNGKMEVATIKGYHHKKKFDKNQIEIVGMVKNLSPKLWQYVNLTVLRLNNNQLTRISPDVQNLKLLHKLDLSGNKLRSLPAEIGNLYCLRELHLNNNMLRVLPYEIGKLFNLMHLGLSGNPLNQDILSLYKVGITRLLNFLLDNLAVTAPEPPVREWIQKNEALNIRGSCVFSVMSYNVLCQRYATRQLYGYCPPWALLWDYRKKTIMREISFYSADILSLQEVETSEYEDHFKPELLKMGYEGIFSPKSRANHMNSEEKKLVDGCAIFWKISKFKLVEEHLIEFNKVAMLNNGGSTEMLNRVTTKDNIGIAALLETTDGIYEATGSMGQPQLVLAVNAHMHWDPEFSDVKLIQTVMLCYELRNFCDEVARNMRHQPTNQHQGRSSAGLSAEFHKIPIVMCGDFNSLPDSGVVEFLQQGQVSASHPDFRDIKYSKCLSVFQNSLHPSTNNKNNQKNVDSKIVTHPFKFKSCYDKEMDKLRYTNITYDFKGIIDYIFYSHTQLKCLGVLSGLDQAWFDKNSIAGCPHPHLPSDHICIVSEFQLLPGNHSPTLAEMHHQGNYGNQQQQQQMFQQPDYPRFNRQRIQSQQQNGGNHQQQGQQWNSNPLHGNPSPGSNNLHGNNNQQQGRFPGNQQGGIPSRPGSAQHLVHSNQSPQPQHHGNHHPSNQQQVPGMPRR